MAGLALVGDQLKVLAPVFRALDKAVPAPADLANSVGAMPPIVLLTYQNAVVI